MKKEKVRISSGKLWMGSIVAALLCAVAVFMIMLQIEKNMLSRFEKANVLAAVCEIPRGQVINEENWKTYICVKEVDKSCIASASICEIADVCTMSALYDIEEGTLLTKGMFEPLQEVLSEMKEPVIASIKADDLCHLAGGILRPGDRIHIYRVSDLGEVMIGWENVFVQQVFDHSGLAISGDDRASAAQRINVYMDKDSMEEFYAQLATGSLRAVKVLR